MTKKYAYDKIKNNPLDVFSDSDIQRNYLKLEAVNRTF